MEKEKRWGLALGAMAEIYSRELTTTALKVYYSIFNKNGFTAEQVEKAIEYLLETRVYSNMPTPAEFISAIKGKVEQKAAEQAEIALRMVTGGVMDFEDPITKHLMQGRWEVSKLRKTLLEKNEVFFIKEFKERYISIQSSEFGKELGWVGNKQIDGLINKIANKK